MQGLNNQIRGWVVFVCALCLTACAGGTDRDRIRAAALYAYGPYQYALNMDRVMQRNRAAGVGLNEMAYLRDLADHRSRSVTAPNADTIYGSAVLDLSGGPVELIVPEAGERYVSVMLMDIFSDVIATVGTGRKADGDAEKTTDMTGRYWIVGPDWTGDTPPGITPIRAPGADAWLLARVFVAGPGDLEDARAVQSRIGVKPVDPAPLSPFPVTPDPDASARNALDLVNTLLGRSPDHMHTQRAAAFSDIGLRPGQRDVWDSLGPATQLKWRAAFDRMPDALEAALLARSEASGWRPAPDNLSRYGTDDATRAAVSLIGFGAMQVEDASYFSSNTDAQGRRLSGMNDYVMTLQPDAIPVDGFWSLSVYAVEADGRRFFIDNPINRHAVNSATPGLVLDDDGQLTLQLSPDRPASDANWLPTPDGEFALIFRTYLPQAPILSGDWTPPDLIRSPASATP